MHTTLRPRPIQTLAHVRLAYIFLELYALKRCEKITMISKLTDFQFLVLIVDSKCTICRICHDFRRVALRLASAVSNVNNQSLSFLCAFVAARRCMIGRKSEIVGYIKRDDIG